MTVRVVPKLTQTVMSNVAYTVSNRPRLAALLCVLMLAMSVTPAVGETSPPSEQSASPDRLSALSGGEAVVFAQENETTTNETKQHEDPDETSEDGSASSIAQWLSGSMAARLNGGAINISQGQYQTASSIIGDDFNDDLSRFVNVAGETDAGVDQQTVETFNETRQTQQRYAEQVQRYWELYDEYQEAREAGNTERARELARELDALQPQINATGQQLEENYGALGNQTGESFDTGIESIRQVRGNVSSTTASVLEESLIATEIQITNVSERASFTEPLVVEGRFVTENGTAVAGSEVTVPVPGSQSTVMTDANGTFTLTHRPVALRTGIQNLTVVATPNTSSAYQSATATIATEIDAVEPTLTITAAPEQVSYGEAVSVEAQLLVDGQPVEAVPLNVTLDGRLLERNLTAANGRLAAAPRLPATIDDGTADLSVRVGWDSRAIESVEVAQAVTVEQTETELSLTAINGTEVHLAGTLQTSDGDAVASQPVEIRVAGEVVETVRTNESGGYSTTLDNATIAPNEGVAVSATYDATGSNLGPSEARTGAYLESAAETNPNASGSLWLSTPVLLGGAIVLLLGFGSAGYLWWRRRDPETSSETPMGDEQQSSTHPEPTPIRTIEDVESHLEQGNTDDAAVTLYSVLQSKLQIDGSEDLTHWERYRSVRESLTPEEVTLLERATELYERAQFAPASVSTEQVRDVFETVSERLDVTTSEQPADD